MAKISKQPKHRGVVVIAKFDGYGKGFGFIEPAGGSGSREENIFFGRAALQAETIERGDEVDYILSVHPPTLGPNAYRVWIRKRAIDRDDYVTTLAGELDT